MVVESRLMEYITREVTEFELHHNNMSREEGFSLSKL
jgi:hypothetical protein